MKTIVAIPSANDRDVLDGARRPNASKPRRQYGGGQVSSWQDTDQPVGVKGAYAWLRPVMTRRHGHVRHDETEQNE